MKVAVVFVLLFAGVLCRSARKYDSSAESSEEVVRRPAAPIFRKRVDRVSQIRAAAVRALQRFLAPAIFDSDESSDSSDKVAVDTPAVVNYNNYETTDPAASDTPPVDNNDDEDSDDDDDDDSEESDSEEEDEEEEDDSSESGESTTLAPDTVTPVIVTDEPLYETTEEPLVPTIVTDTDSGRGDSMGGYPGDYKTYVYMQEKNYHKAPSPYKSYGYDSGKKSGYDMPTGNEVEKGYKMESYPQVHSDLLEGDSSTPEEESENLDTSGPSENQDVLPAEEEEEEEEENAGTNDSGSSSNPEEEEEESASQEAAATPGAADSDSDESESSESDSDERGKGPGPTADTVVITAK
ncbi:osteopontin isoform X2 [Nerophis lumbriciformis]|uniref:osteopontin isoform X2 n=1 Tax=Nerophis lumbriciformis TaxID=546530 RepID=UPI003BAA532D